MNTYMEKLETYLEENKSSILGSGMEPIWERLYWAYIESNPTDSALIRQKYEELDGCMAKLTIRENDRVMDLLSNLCMEHEKAAFFAGVQTGVRLLWELWISPDSDEKTGQGTVYKHTEIDKSIGM